MSDEKFLSDWRHFGIRWLGGCAIALAACTADGSLSSAESAAPALHAAEESCAAGTSAILRNALGTEVGRVTFAPQGDATLVEVTAALPDVESGIRGMHIHANDNPDNGEGCIADPMQPASTHFASADGHYTSHSGTSHGEHSGDLPALFIMHSGEASLRFVSDRFDSEEVIGRAVILHVGPDNYGNIPVGDAPEQYTPNDPAATDLTARTGNAGARYACGVIE